MGLNFKKSINLGKGFKLNVGKKSVGISGGVKGARVSVNSSGRKTATFSLPGTGLSYSVNLNKLFKGNSSKKKKSGSSDKNTGININLILIIIILILIAIIGIAVYAYLHGLI